MGKTKSPHQTKIAYECVECHTKYNNNRAAEQAMMEGCYHCGAFDSIEEVPIVASKLVYNDELEE